MQRWMMREQSGDAPLCSNLASRFTEVTSITVIITEEAVCDNSMFWIGWC